MNKKNFAINLNFRRRTWSASVGYLFHDIEPLEDLTEAIEEIPIATAQAYDFWTLKTLEELAQTQGVKPIDDITALYGTWPGDVDDGFEEFVQELRQGNLIGKDSL